MTCRHSSQRSTTVFPILRCSLETEAVVAAAVAVAAVVAVAVAVPAAAAVVARAPSPLEAQPLARRRGFVAHAEVAGARPMRPTLRPNEKTLLGAKGIASSNKCLTTSNKKLVVTISY